VIALSSGNDLLAERATPQTVDGVEFLEESISLSGELNNGWIHGLVISV
jgi:hypothetical protein